MSPRGDKRLLVFGFRRLKAAERAGLATVPCVVRDMDDREVAEARLVENLQREDLSAIEEGRAFKTYLDSFKVSQTELAKKIGKSQPYVSNRVRLVDLEPEIHALITRGILTPSNAEVLLKIPADAPASGYHNRDDDKETLRLQMARELGTSPTSEFNREVVWSVKRYEENKKRHEELLALLNSCEVKTCPICAEQGGPGSPSTVDKVRAKGEVKGKKTFVLLGDAYNHYWRGDTGESWKRYPYDAIYGKRYSDVYGGGGGVEGGDDGGSRQKRDQTEPASYRSGHGAHEIASGLLKTIGKENVDRVLFLSDGYRSRLEVIFKKSALKELDGVAVSIIPHEYKTGEKTNVQVQAQANDYRKKMKKTFLAWEKKNLRDVKLKASPKTDARDKVLAKKLEGSVAKVSSVVGNLSSLEDLERLRELEVAGKNRVGVLDVLDRQVEGAHGDKDGIGEDY